LVVGIDDPTMFVLYHSITLSGGFWILYWDGLWEYLFASNWVRGRL